MDATAYRVERPLLPASALATARDAEFSRAGERVYKQFTPEEQGSLREVLEGSVNGTADPKLRPLAEQWRSAIEQQVRATVERRLARGDHCDVYAVVDEVMPAALAAVPADVRAALMQQVNRKLSLPDQTNLSVTQ
jgi:hypothetical protein